jgi:uncharacterized damage-inducible protein DinB
MSSSTVDTPFVSADALRQHWQGHRRLTRRIIDAFPDEALFDYTIGGMRPFAALAKEFLTMAIPTLQGVITGQWTWGGGSEPKTKGDILAQWDETTAEIDRLWPTIPQGRFQEVDTAFGQWKMPMHAMILYIIDNEVHHRGQGYVYLRALGISPPPFYERD